MLRGDAITTALVSASEGDRVVLNGKTVWAGLGNRSGLHDFANDLIKEKWDKSGARFTKKMNRLEKGDRLLIQVFKNKTRDRGFWSTARVIVVK